MRRLALAALALFALRGDMYPDASNAKLPEALNNLAANTSANTYYAQAYGSCDWTAGGDVGPCVNAAITAARAAGGGTVVVPAGSYGLSTTITQTQSPGVTLSGAGGVGHYGVCGTRLTWLGAAGGTMYDAGPANNNIVGGGLRHLCFAGNSTALGTGAGIGVRLRAVSWGVYEDVHVGQVQTTAWDLDAGNWANGGLAKNRFVATGASLDTPGAINAGGWKLGQGAVTSLDDTWGNIWLGGITQYQNGTGFECGAADSNDVIAMDVQPVLGGTGKSLHLLGSAAGLYCRSNRFHSAIGWGNSVATRPVADTGTVPSNKNYIYQNQESGAQPPQILGAATVWCRNNFGANCGNLGAENLTQTSPANPTGAPTGGARTMLGLAAAFTPRTTGIVEVEIVGALQGSLNTTSANINIIGGTGTAPANGAGVPGAAVQGGNLGFDAGVAVKKYPFTVKARLALTGGTAYWFDLGIASFNGVTTPTELTVFIREII